MTRSSRTRLVATVLALACVGATTAAHGGAARDLARDTGYLLAHHPERPAVNAVLPAASSYDTPVVAGGRRAGTATVSRTGLSTWEPTLGARGDEVFVQVAGARSRTSVGRSVDGGRTWTVVAPSLGGDHPHRVSLDPYLHVDPTPGGARLYLADLAGGCSFLSTSGDGGRTWTRTTLACAPGFNDHEHVFTGRPVLSPTSGTDRVVYYCYSTIVVSECARSLDGGASFLPPGAPVFTAVDPAAGQGTGTADVDHLCFTPALGHGVAGKDGTLYLPRGHCGQPWLAVSRDEGLTWARYQVADIGVATVDSDPSHEASVGVAEDGTVYYGWIAADRLPYAAFSTDGGRSWSRPVRLPSAGLVQTRLAALAVAADGTVAAAFLGSADAPRPPVAGEDDLFPNGAAGPYARATWHGFVVTGQIRHGRPSWRTTRVSPPRDPLVRGECHPNRCLGVGDFLDIQVDGRTAWAAFVDACITACASSAGAENNAGEALVVRVPLGPTTRR